MSRIYVASSWRNEQQPAVVEALRANGHEVYDFRHPNVQGPPNAPESGFGWRECHPNPPPWSAEETRRVLMHERAREGFAADHAAMQWADTFVLLQPCGRSAHLELGWACGAGKRTIVLLVDGHEPELMLLEATWLAVTLDEVLQIVGVAGVRVEHFRKPVGPPPPTREDDLADLLVRVRNALGIKDDNGSSDLVDEVRRLKDRERRLSLLTERVIPEVQVCPACGPVVAVDEDGEIPGRCPECEMELEVVTATDALALVMP